MHDPGSRDPLVTAHAILSLKDDNGPFTFHVAKDGRRGQFSEPQGRVCVRDVRWISLVMPNEYQKCEVIDTGGELYPPGYTAGPIVSPTEAQAFGRHGGQS